MDLLYTYLSFFPISLALVPQPHWDHLGPLTNGATSPGRHSKVPLVSMVLRALLKERCAILPFPFMKAQQTKVIPKCVFHWIGIVSNKSWKLRLSHSLSHGLLGFTFTSGWIQFVTHNRIVEGDILVFSKLMVNMSKFQMYVFDYEGLPITAHLRSALMQASRTQVQKSMKAVSR